MRALPHIFPSTDRQHAVVTPGLLLLGQILAQTPIKTRYDVVVGLFISGLMLEYTKGAKRAPPEAIAFLASALRLFADDLGSTLSESPLPSFSNAFKSPQLATFRSLLGNDATNVCLSLEKDEIQSDACPLAILNTSLHLSQQAFIIMGKSEHGSERDFSRTDQVSPLHLGQTKRPSASSTCQESTCRNISCGLQHMRFGCSSAATSASQIRVRQRACSQISYSSNRGSIEV